MLTLDEYLRRWQHWGLRVDDREEALRFISVVSPFRLKGYLSPFIRQRQDGTRYIRDGFTFARLLDLYNFDRELRLVVLHMLERIEIAVRAQLVQQVCESCGDTWYLDEAIYRRTPTNPDAGRQLIAQIGREIDRSSDQFVTNHRRRHGAAHPLPAWKAIEILSFGTVSRIYQQLDRPGERKRIAEAFGLGSSRVLANWIHVCAAVRNIAAHHARLYNRRLVILPLKRETRRSSPWLQYPVADNHWPKLYVALSIMQFLLAEVSPGNRFGQRFRWLADDYPGVDFRHMGFHPRWREEPLWQ